MRRLGQDSLIRRIKQFDVVNLPVPSAKRADSLLNKYELYDVRQNSAGAGTFYVWVSEKLKGPSQGYIMIKTVYLFLFNKCKDIESACS